MATTINVYDRKSNTTKPISIDVGSATIGGSDSGNSAYYITVSTSSRDPLGNVIPQIVLTDADISWGISDAVNAAVVSLFNSLIGTDLPDNSSSSSSSSKNSSSSSSSSKNSSSSSSSSSPSSPSSRDNARP